MTGKTRNLAEKKLEASIMRNMTRLGFDVVKLSQPQRALCTRGTPDLWIRHRAWKLRLWVEVKTPKGRVSPFQAYWIGTELACGGHAIVARSTADVIAELVRLGAPITV